jgi:cyanate permease
MTGRCMACSWRISCLPGAESAAVVCVMAFCPQIVRHACRDNPSVGRVAQSAAAADMEAALACFMPHTYTSLHYEVKICFGKLIL